MKSELNRQHGVQDKILGILIDRGLAVPAVFLLELCKPLSGVGHAGAILCEPILGALFGFRNAKSLSRFFENRQNIEQVIARIEALSRQELKQG